MDRVKGSGQAGRGWRPLVLLLFFGSGLASLVLEVTWTRMLGTVFGNTVFAASTVLTAFMLGLALGSALLGRVADRIARPLLLYGALEIGVGVYAFLFPLLIAATNLIYGAFFRAVDPGFTTLSAVRFALSLALLLPPTILMGGTLPVLGRHLGSRKGEPGREVGYLYAFNTFGAVAGSFLAGFILLRFLGIRMSLFAAGGAALSVGLLAVLAGWRPAAAAVRTEAQPVPVKRKKSKAAPPHATIAREPLAPATFRLVLIAFGVTGFCALAYEVLWTRILLFVMTTTCYSFVTMLTTFLAGLAIGSFLSSRFLVPRIGRPVLWFGVIEVLVGLAALVSVPLLGRAWQIDLSMIHRVRNSAGEWSFLIPRLVDAAVVMLPAAILMGAAFPVVTVACLRGEAPLGRRVGLVYAVNTIGCVLGSFFAGFVLLPLIGAHNSLLLLVAMNFAVGAALVWHALPRSLATRSAVAAPLALAAVIAFIVTPSDIFHETINTFHYPGKVIHVREHCTGTVTVHDLPGGDRLIAVDGVNVAGLNFMLRSTQKLQAYIPLLLHPNPRRVVQIGFGSGETARVGRDFGVEEWRLVEICPAIFEAGKFFESINKGSYRDPRIRKVIMDGKNWALLSDEKFDIVMNDSIFPGSSGSSALYTYDHFLHCRERLEPGGLFSCWVPLDLRPVELAMILKSFQEVFPHTSFWVASNCLNKHALILGSVEPFRFDFAHVQKVMSRPDVAADLKAIEIHNAYDFLDCFVLDENAVRKFAANAPLNTDDRMNLEFSCAVPKDWETILAKILLALVEHQTPVTPYVVNFTNEAQDRPELTRRFGATKCIFTAQAAELRRMAKQRQTLLEMALRANPGEVHVASCDNEIRKEVEDLKLVLDRLPTNREIAARLANKLFIVAHQPFKTPDPALYREAGLLYQQLVRATPPPAAQVFTNLAEIQFASKQATEAEGTLRECLSIYPNFAPAHDQLAGIYARTGAADLARRHSEEAVRLAPNDPLIKIHRDEIVRLTGS